MLSTLVASTAFGKGEVLAQLGASQVITLTTGSQGEVTTRRSFSDETQEQLFTFSQSSDEEDVRETSPRRRNREGQFVQETFEGQVTTFSSQIEQGTITRVQRVELFDSFEYSQANFSQSFNISY